MFGNRYFPSRYFGDRYWAPGGSLPPTPEPEVIIDVDGLRRRDRDAEEFFERQKASKEQLRAAIERAFGDAPKEQPAAPPVRREMARLVLADIRTDGLTASLKRIERLVAEYEEQIEEEEAVVALLLTH